MKYLEFEDFEFIINLFNTYPKNLMIEFFVKDESSLHFLLGTLKASLKNIKEFHQTSFNDYYFLSKNEVKISIVKNDSLDCRRHLRGNLIVCDSSYSYEVISECFLPFYNLKPQINFLLWYKNFPKEYCGELILKSDREYNIEEKEKENENKKSN